MALQDDATLGDVQILPPEPDPEGDNKPRPHVLLTRGVRPSGTLTFAHCTTKDTEVAPRPSFPGARPPAAAPHVVIDPLRPGTRTTGLWEQSYVLLNRLLSIEPDKQEPCVGRVVDELDAIRAALPNALGLGEGTGREGPHLGCNRGLLVEFQPHVAAMIGTQIGAVVMEPAYSLRLRMVTVVPIFDATLFEVNPGDVVFDADRGDDWLTVFGMRHAFAAIGDIFGARWRARISRPLRASVPAAAMARIDAALRVHFDLPEPAAV